ncbi:HCL428Wp [Eremothecium sinecaudum]|uniref:HCL428Wp n=1 Tax=Eremothecium sinecaudum TaxID=45286 RepID=A0A109UY75_9SACH|nr:HCL428Wp [Eremothecium sinecaudum]AMD19723.1 HCL428Wp [Eremothecium sinecaudum]
MLLFYVNICKASFAQLAFRRSFAIYSRSRSPTKVTLTLNLNDDTPILDNISSKEDSNEPDRLKFTDRGSRTIKNSIPPSLRQIQDMMKKYKGHVVLTQMGSFYELYFEQARTYAPKLNITLTSRKYNHGKVDFAGFPVEHLCRYLKVLVKEHGYSVAIADQFKREGIADNDPCKYHRRVTRIVTPGTFIDEAFENLQDNQFLLSIVFRENCFNKLSQRDLPIGLAWCDISTGELFVQEVQLSDLITAVNRIKPKEILLSKNLAGLNIENGDWYPELVEFRKYFLTYQTYPGEHRTLQSFSHLFSTKKNGRDFEIATKQFSQKEVSALRSLLYYINETIPDGMVNLELPKQQIITSMMQIDTRTCAALELQTRAIDNHKKGSLMSVIRRTVTPSGNRLLARWLAAPSMDLVEILTRQKLVKVFIERYFDTQRLVEYLKDTTDMARLLQKFSFRKVSIMELRDMARTLKDCNAICDILTGFVESNKRTNVTEKKMAELINTLKFDPPIANTVLNAIDESTIERLKDDSELNDLEVIENRNETDILPFKSEVSVLKRDASEMFNALHLEFELAIKRQHELLDTYTQLFVKEGVKSCKLMLQKKDEPVIKVMGGSAVIKRIIENINNGKLQISENFHIIRKSSTFCILSHPAWDQLCRDIRIKVLEIKEEEEKILNGFREGFINCSEEIRNISHSLDYLDVLTSFAKLSREKNLVCPIVDLSEEFEIIGGRNIVVEDALQLKSLKKFTPNDSCIKPGNLWVITGPNMGGKSTFLRQNAIIAILAQIGCFVPCESARIGLVDKIFSRVGSADDLYNDMSTFMVEMIETSFILKGATSRSLAILDEVGRGTAMKEGICISYAALSYLLNNNKCRTLFATHFGSELSQLINSSMPEVNRRKIHFYKSGIKDFKTSYFYDYNMKKGICDKSDALRVAELSGFPVEAINIARNVWESSS